MKPGRVLLCLGAPVMALALGGCAKMDLGPLGIATPSGYRADAADRAAPPVDPQWPRLFGSAELTVLAAQAQAGNLDIAAAAARIIQAEAQAVASASALYPQVDASGSASRSLSSGTRTKNPPYEQSVGNAFSLGLSASYVIDFFGRNRILAEAGRLSAEATRFDRDTVVLATAGSVVSAYVQILAAQDRLALARGNIRGAERVLTAIRTRLEVGTATALDVAQQESVLANQRANVPQLEQTIQQTRNNLAVLLGRTPQSMSVKGGSLNGLKAPAVRPGLPSQLLLRRPDIARARVALVAQQSNAEAARLAFFPSFNLTAQGGVQSVLLKTLLRPEATFASLAGGIAQPIFDGYQLQADLARQRGVARERLEDYRKAILTALADVENALIAVQKSAEQERLQRLALAAARRSYEITEQRLREGTIDIVTLLQTQQNLFSAQDALVQVRAQRLLAVAGLFQALGGGFTMENDLLRLADALPAPAPVPAGSGGRP